MAKWAGIIGFAVSTEETSPNIYEDNIKEIHYFGNIIKNSRKFDSQDKVNNDISVSNSISVLADPYAISHIYDIRYVTFCGTKWEVSSVQVDYPRRLTLSLGGVYNG